MASDGMGPKMSGTGHELGPDPILEIGDDTAVSVIELTGAIKWFDVAKGFGFIVPDDPSQTDLKDVLLHVTSLRNSGRDNCLEGSSITCDVVRRPKGWQVAEVVEIDESSAPPPTECKVGDEDAGA